MFVSLERLAPTPNFRPTRTPTAPTTKATLLPDAVRSWLGLEGHKNSGSRFQKGDGVVINNKDQILIHGTVKWTGTANTDGSKVNAIGIETVGAGLL